MLLAAALVAFAFGACAGSFLGVVVHRMPRGLSIVTPGSRCGACGTCLSAFENLPILGWLLLRGRCRHCGTAIPASCLWFELAVATLSAALAWGVLAQPHLWCLPLGVAGHPFLAMGAALAVLLALAWFLTAAVMIDWDHLIIPDELTKGLQVLAIPLALATGANLIWGWNPQWWLRTWDPLDGWVGTPGGAAVKLAIVVGTVLALTMASLWLARRIYGRLAEAWSDDDHRAMRAGAFWWAGWTALWTIVTAGLILWLGAGVAASDYHPGRIAAIVLVQAILGSLTGWWLPWLVGLVGTIAFKRNAMGYGDVKLFAALGAFLGPVGTLAAFVLAVLAGALIGIPARLLGGGREIPFGPSLAIGAVAAIAAGPWLDGFIRRLFS